MGMCGSGPLKRLAGFSFVMCSCRVLQRAHFHGHGVKIRFCWIEARRRLGMREATEQLEQQLLVDGTLCATERA